MNLFNVTSLQAQFFACFLGVLADQPCFYFISCTVSVTIDRMELIHGKLFLVFKFTLYKRSRSILLGTEQLKKILKYFLL